MRKIRLFVVLSFLFGVTLMNVNGQNYADPKDIATSATSSLSYILKNANLKMDSLTTKKVYNCYFVNWAAYNLKIKDLKDASSRGAQFDQYILKLDSCLNKILTKGQYNLWKEKGEEAENPHDQHKYN